MPTFALPRRRYSFVSNSDLQCDRVTLRSEDRRCRDTLECDSDRQSSQNWKRWQSQSRHIRSSVLVWGPVKPFFLQQMSESPNTLRSGDPQNSSRTSAPLRFRHQHPSPWSFRYHGELQCTPAPKLVIFTTQIRRYIWSISDRAWTDSSEVHPIISRHHGCHDQEGPVETSHVWSSSYSDRKLMLQII